MESRTINLVFVMPTLAVLARWLWPLPLPLWVKIPAGRLMLAASHFHLWSRLRIAQERCRTLYAHHVAELTAAA